MKCSLSKSFISKVRTWDIWLKIDNPNHVVIHEKTGFSASSSPQPLIFYMKYKFLTWKFIKSFKLMKLKSYIRLCLRNPQWSHFLCNSERLFCNCTFFYFNEMVLVLNKLNEVSEDNLILKQYLEIANSYWW